MKLIARAGSTRMNQLLKESSTAAMAGRWLLDTGLLQQFRAALDIGHVKTE